MTNEEKAVVNLASLWVQHQQDIVVSQSDVVRTQKSDSTRDHMIAKAEHQQAVAQLAATELALLEAVYAMRSPPRSR